MQKRLWRIMKIHWKKLLLLRGDHTKIARGIALGVSMNFIPTVGIGPPLVYWLAGMTRAHRVAAIVSTVGVKVSIPILYFLNFIVGELLIKQRINFSFDWNGVMNMGESFLLGMAINFSVTFVVSYYLSLHWIRKRREKLFSRKER